MASKPAFAISAFGGWNNSCFYPYANEQVFLFSLQEGQPFRDPDFIFIFETILSVTQAGLKLASLEFLTSLLPPTSGGITDCATTPSSNNSDFHPEFLWSSHFTSQALVTEKASSLLQLHRFPPQTWPGSRQPTVQGPFPGLPLFLILIGSHLF